MFIKNHSFDNNKGICGLEIIKFIIILTEYASSKSAIHTWLNPELILKPFCKSNNLAITEILCMCHMNEDSYFLPTGHKDVYRMCKFKENADSSITKIYGRTILDKEIINNILNEVENSNITLKELEEKFELFKRKN